MIIAQKLKEQNIAEWLLYMWQVEDLLRGVSLDVDKLEDSYLSRFQLEGEQRAELRRWYEDLAEMMRSEGVTHSGHLQICKNVIIWLDDLHRRLLKSPKHPVYSATYYQALPFIVELRSRIKDKIKDLKDKKDLNQSDHIKDCKDKGDGDKNPLKSFESLTENDSLTEKSEIENCFDALYGLMLLRLQGKPVSEETKKAMGYISKFIALLAEYYKKDKTESIEL